MAALDGLVRRLVSGTRWLVLPVVALLFLQWPLREIVRGFSREANDLGQWLFARIEASLQAATFFGAPPSGTASCPYRPPSSSRDTTRAVKSTIGTMRA